MDWLIEWWIDCLNDGQIDWVMDLLYALWSEIKKNTDVRTGPLARPFARSLTPLTRPLAPDCSLCSRPPLRSLVRSLAHFAHSLARGKVNFWCLKMTWFCPIVDCCRVYGNGSDKTQSWWEKIRGNFTRKLIAKLAREREKLWGSFPFFFLFFLFCVWVFWFIYFLSINKFGMQICVLPA